MTQNDTSKGGSAGLLGRCRDALPVVLLALSLPLTLAWIGGLTFVGYEAVAWLVETIGG